MVKRFGQKEGLISFIIPGISYSMIAFGLGYSMWPYFYYVKNETFIVLGAFALWRYGWQLIHYVRSTLYAFLYYPKLKRIVAGVPEESKYPQHIYFVIPSFKEEPWVSIESFQSIFSNLATVPCRATLIVSTGSDQDDAIISATFDAHPVRDKVELVLQRQSQGKRIAMGHALRAVARRYEDEPNSVTIFMDGDSYLESDTLNKTIPFFATFRDLGALTTNEVAYINTSSDWYKEWFNLKFGQRHVLFQSQSLSNKVLTLTGRFSMFRTSVIIKEEFIKKLETDVITHWRHGKFKFLMGDDKTTWFYLLKNKWNMLYIPDVTTYSLESRDANFLSVSTSLPYRWYGNTLRNNDRALALGWRTTGFFIWIAILDQRLSMWTSLVGITGAVILAIFSSYIYLPFYFAWVFGVRVIQMFVIAARGHPVSMLTIPLMLYSQWFGAIVKIRAYFNLSDQKWSKGGTKQTSDDNIAMIEHPLVRWLPSYLMFSSYAVFIFALLLAQGAISMPDLAFFNQSQREAVIESQFYGVTPDDGRDDALALQDIIDRLPDGKSTVIRLPRGTIDLYQPILLKSRVSLHGLGPEETHLVSHLKRPAEAVIALHGKKGKGLGTLTKDAAPHDRRLYLSNSKDIRPGDLLLLEMPNDSDFLRTLNSQQWDKQYPYLRKTLVEVKRIHDDGVVVRHPPGLSLHSSDTRVFRVNPVTRVQLKGFTIEQRVPGAAPAEVRFQYENLYPDYAVDAISGKWAAHCLVEDVHILNSGRHPLAFDNVYACRARNLVISGAWNKGKQGHGYVKLSRTFRSHFIDSEVNHIRHIVLQWSSAYNALRNIRTGVDVNLHGGYVHDNVIQDIEFAIPESHPWRGVVHTPADAHWAPPDGDNTVLVRD